MWGGFSLLFSLCSCSLSGLIHVNDYRMKPHRQQLWIYCSFLEVPTGDGRRRGEGKGGVVPWGGHNTSIANQRGQIPYSVTWGLEAFEIPTFNSRSLSPFYLKTVSVKHKIFLLFSPNISCCSSLSQCNVLPGERCNFLLLLAVCSDWALEMQLDGHAWASGDVSTQLLKSSSITAAPCLSPRCHPELQFLIYQ